MARPKGVLQKRNEAKYWLPDGISLKLGQIENFNKETKLIFIDVKYGEFISSFRAIQAAKNSTHPLAVVERRIKTNIEKYGMENAGATKESRQKAQNTMQLRYGVRNALESKQFLEKSQNTLMQNFGVISTMDSQVIKDKITVKREQKTEEQLLHIKNKTKNTNLEKYGVDNPAKHPKIREKFLKTLSENKFQSKGEQELCNYLKSLGFTPYQGYFGGANPKQIDIKLKESNICFEYNGAYWHSEAIKQITPNYHLEKTKLAQENNHRLVHIFDFEWEKRQFQVKSFIRSMLGKNEIRIYARKTILKEVDKKTAHNFLETYHILGKVGFKKAFGLYYNNELLALATITFHHRNNNEMVLNRFVCKENVTVSGGLSKLTSYLAKEYPDLSTWIDLRFSTGENWLKCGWEMVHTLKPDYFYFDSKTRNIISKQKRKKKDVNTPENMTEHEHALKDKLFRVYDCGKIKLRIKKGPIL